MAALSLYGASVAVDVAGEHLFARLRSQDRDAAGCTRSSDLSRFLWLSDWVVSARLRTCELCRALTAKEKSPGIARRGSYRRFGLKRGSRGWPGLTLNRCALMHCLDHWSSRQRVHRHGARLPSSRAAPDLHS